jgi:hypothetical protein
LEEVEEDCYYKSYESREVVLVLLEEYDCYNYFDQDRGF